MDLSDSEDDFHDVDSSFNATRETVPEVEGPPASPSLARSVIEVERIAAGESPEEQPPNTTVDETLTGAAGQLQLLEGIQVAAAEFANLVPPFNEVAEHVEPIDQEPDNLAENFDVENGTDGAKAIEHTRDLKIEYAPEDVAFWFIQLENEMITCEVKSQWLKRVVLVKNLPTKVQSDVRSLLILQKAQAPTDLYKQIKDEILRIYAPKKEDTYKKALSRVLVGLPSQLGHTLVNDICDKSPKLTGCCCSKAVFTLWNLQLPLGVRSMISNLEFNETTYSAVFQAADKVYLSTKDAQMSPGVAAIAASEKGQSGEGSQNPQVAALNQRRGRGGRGGRSGRGGSGQSGRGGNNNSTNTSSNSSSKPQGRGPRHASNPPNTCCDNHFRFGDQSWSCQSPFTCPWKDKIVPKKSDKQ